MTIDTLIIDKKFPAFKLRGWVMERLFRWSYPVYGAIFKRRQKAWYWTKQQLRDFQPGSMGKEIYYFLNSQGFEMLAKFEDHDALHVVLGYSSHVVDEVRMQFCLFGNGKRSLYLFGVICIGWLAFPECWHLFTEAFKRGRASAPVHRWKFEHLLREPLFVLRNHLNGSPSEEVPLFI
jgi:hypothetical protein